MFPLSGLLRSQPATCVSACLAALPQHACHAILLRQQPCAGSGSSNQPHGTTQLEGHIVVPTARTADAHSVRMPLQPISVYGNVPAANATVSTQLKGKQACVALSAPSQPTNKASQSNTKAAQPKPQPAVASGPCTVSDYERARQERIAANLARMKELGLENGIAAHMVPAAPAKAPARKTLKRTVEQPLEPVRRSSRTLPRIMSALVAIQLLGCLQLYCTAVCHSFVTLTVCMPSVGCMHLTFSVHLQNGRTVGDRRHQRSQELSLLSCRQEG